ncbi:hypothetical protein OG21DRAFT_1027214 [Imleria badia]|nr:hypothetical protein OG21DRAFT_1027214 [Imleria badia]
MTRKRRKQERAKANSETLTEVSLERSSLAAHITEGEPEADASSIDATCATTPSVAETEDMDDVAITAFDKSCSISAGSEPVSTTSFGIQARDLSPDLVHPPSDSMDVDAGTSVTDVIPNPTCEVAEVLGPSTSKPPSGIPVSQFYACMPKPEDEKQVVIVDNEDSGEDQQQEAEVDDMLAVTQSPTGDLPAQYVAPLQAETSTLIDSCYRLARTHIFTLDSLGTRHPQAIKVLKQYLISEARDKRSFDEVRDAVGKQVQVYYLPTSLRQ